MFAFSLYNEDRNHQIDFDANKFLGGAQLKTIALAGTFDTKGTENLYIKQLIENLGMNVFTIHTGVFESAFPPDVSNQEIAKAAGSTIEELAAKKDRAYATKVLAEGMKKLLPILYQEGKFDGILAFGGSGGTSLITPGMQQLPIGVPKVMVSTLASGDTSPYVGTSDIMMLPSIVDVSGLNSISTKIFANAVSAIVGMLQFPQPVFKEEKPLIGATMFGVTTPAVTTAREYLERKGYEVLVFHATGIGGRTMESLIDAGYIKGVLDLTTTEWADEIVGGVLSAGKHRLEVASRNHIPQVVSVGALDMVNFGPVDTVPDKFKERNLYQHNPTVTLMRTTPEENRLIGEQIAKKLNMATDQTIVVLPLKGISAIDEQGQPFYDPKTDQVLFDTLKNNISNPKVKIIEKDEAINDPEFAEFAAQTLIDLMNN